VCVGIVAKDQTFAQNACDNDAKVESDRGGVIMLTPPLGYVDLLLLKVPDGYKFGRKWYTRRSDHKDELGRVLLKKSA
jgi:hypothetical protein